jgi:hypothetical protein
MSFEQYCQIVEGIRVRRVQSSNRSHANQN